jgi:hypothetical protein
MFPSSRSEIFQSIITMLAVFVITTLFLQASYGIRATQDIVYRAPNVASPEIPLDVFQVEAPLRKTYEGAVCEQVVLQHNFAASYGSPGVGMTILS